LNVAEINPISVHADALIALDARLILAEEQAR
jgi:succinyl-CoA synthetase beta subunit